MPTVALTTFQDLIDHGASYLGDTVSKDAVRDAKRAALDAYRDVAAAHRWSYYTTLGHINATAAYSTGTIDFDLTGGSYERLVTLAGGTWPDWARQGRLVISSVPYQIAERLSGSQVTLLHGSNPGADVASGTSYTLLRDTYPLPADFLSLDDVVLTAQSRCLKYVHPQEWLSRQRIYHSPSVPWAYTILGNPDFYGAMALSLFPAPDQSYALDFVYQRRPRPLLVDNLQDGTVTVSAGSAAVSGSGTLWASKHVGSVLRISDSRTETPTGLSGNYPYAVERVITDVASATSATADSTIATAYSSVLAVVSDPVDVEEGAMLTAVLRGIEKHLAMTRRIKDALAPSVAAFREALLMAREADLRHTGMRAPGGRRDVVRLSDMPAESS